MTEARPDLKAHAPDDLAPVSRMLGPTLEFGLHGAAPLRATPASGGGSRRFPRAAPQYSFWLLEGYR